MRAAVMQCAGGAPGQFQQEAAPHRACPVPRSAFLACGVRRRRAKEKRERLRSAHLAPDYIPLGGAAALTSNQPAADKLRDGSAPGGGAADGGEARASDSGGSGSGSDSEGEGEAGQDLRMQFGPGAAPAPRRKEQKQRASAKRGGGRSGGGAGGHFASALHEVNCLSAARASSSMKAEDADASTHDDS